MLYFFEIIWKNVGGSASKPSLASGGWGLHPQTPPPPLIPLNLRVF